MALYIIDFFRRKRRMTLSNNDRTSLYIECDQVKKKKRSSTLQKIFDKLHRSTTYLFICIDFIFRFEKKSSKMANMAMTMADLQQLGRTEDTAALERTKTQDIESGQIFAGVYWTCDEVADVIELLGFPQYRVCLINALYSLGSNP